LTHLQQLEAESIHILREVAAEFDRPVMLYSIGKDSSVMLHLAKKAFAPGKLPFPLLHIDTTWKFREMIARSMCREGGLELSSAPTHGCATTSTLITARRTHRHEDRGLCRREQVGSTRRSAARRDEERSRAKERPLFRDRNQ
jgi:sulfate adenylyltransferase subunit 2